MKGKRERAAAYAERSRSSAKSVSYRSSQEVNNISDMRIAIYRKILENIILSVNHYW